MPRTALRSTGTLVGALGLLATAAAAAPVASAGPLPTSSCVTVARQVTCTYLPVGAPQTLVVPAGVTSVDVRAVGGVGGKGVTPADRAKPARVTGTLLVDPGEELYVLVGGNGGDATTASDGDTAPGGAPGWNGGGWGGEAQTDEGSSAESGAGGGGASDVRTVADDEPGTLDSRLLVAAGSGGGANVREGGWGDLNGWTLDGYGADAAAMGTTTAGGATGTLWGWLGSDGGYGVGGTGRGMPARAGDAGGGGGGGVYGGGGGATVSSGAGGGSLAPAGGGKGWSDDDRGSVVVTYTLPSPAVVTPPVVVPPVVTPQQPVQEPPAPEPTPVPTPAAEQPVADPATAPGAAPAGAGAARAQVADARIVPGSRQTITGTGFTPGEVVHGVLHSRTVDLGTAVADADGVVTFSVTLPAGFELGSHSAVLSGATSGRVATVDFVVATSSTPGGTTADGAAGASLAYTGASVAVPLGGGLAALGAGTALVLLARRRRARS